MTADIDQAARVVAEWLGWRPTDFPDPGGVSGLWWTAEGAPDTRMELSWLHTYEGMGVVLEGLRAEGWRISIGLVEHVDEGRSTIWEGWNASFYRTGVGYGMKNPMPEADADSLADAVLLAASVAVREAKDE